MAYRYIEHLPYVDLHLEVMWIVEHFVSIFFVSWMQRSLCRSATVQISDCVDFASWIAEHFLTRCVCVYQSANGSPACSGRSQAEDWGS